MFYQEKYGEVANWLKEMADKKIKNKLDDMRKQGIRILRSHVLLNIKRKEKPTGSAADSDDDVESDEISDAQGEEIIVKCKWKPEKKKHFTTSSDPESPKDGFWISCGHQSCRR